MAKQTVGRTALGAAICRLIEQYQPDGTRLFNDRVVKELVGKPIRFLMQFAGIRNFTVKQTDAVMQGLYGAQVCRTRYIDDAVQAAISQGIGQLVILGAGLDTRPYRLSGLEHLKVFEVDLPTVQKDKREKIVKYLGRLPEHVTFVPIVVGTSAHGSVIVFTYVLKSIIERRSDIPGADHMMDVVAKSAPWLFGLEPTDISTFLNQFHLALQADVGNTYYQEKYLKPIRRNMVVSEVERVALATVK